MEDEDEPFPVALAHSDERGRDYVATRPVAPGELVLRVAPLAAVPNDLFATRVCSGCFRRDCTPCPGCGQAALCEACARPGSRAAALHADECAALAQLFGSAETRRLDRSASAAAGPAGRAGVRLLLRLLYARARQQRGAAEGWPDLGEPEGVDVIEDQWDDVWELEDHWHELPDEVAERLVDMSKQAKFVISPSARASIEEAASLLSHCYCNAFKLPLPGDPRTRSRPQSVGVGVFISASFFNHSCRPNCSFALDSNGFLEMRAMRPVSSGELLTISYVPLDGAQSREDRQEGLRRDFFFSCCCEACQESMEECGE